MNLILLTQSPHFNLVKAELVVADSAGEFMDVRRKQEGQCVDDDEKRLWRLCQETDPVWLYQHCADKKKYKRAELLWAGGDEATKKRMRNHADNRMGKLIPIATILGYPIIWHENDKAPIGVSRQLTLREDSTVEPVLCFRRHEEGITYRLQIRIDGETIVPMDHRTRVIAHKPAIFAVDNGLYMPDNEMNGKMIRPFITKPAVEIARKNENDYLRRFILRNVSKADVQAEGFEVHDVLGDPVCRLKTESVVTGGHQISITFVYPNATYGFASTSRGRVTLLEEGDSYTFTRYQRDKDAETFQLETLRDITDDDKLVSTGYKHFDDTESLVAWLQQYSHQLADAGFAIRQPHDKTYYLGAFDIEEDHKAVGDWLQMKVNIRLEDGRTIPFSDLKDTIMAGEREYLLPTGERLIIPEEWIQRYGSTLLVGLRKEKGKDLMVHRTQLGALPYIHDVQWDDDQQKPATPERLMATLRPYQQRGYEWLWRSLMSRMGCCLADEMGLGKTVQAIALLMKYKEVAKREGAIPFKTSLILAPSSVVFNWGDELQRFAPSMMVMTYKGTPEQRAAKREAMMQWDLVVTSYQTLARDIKYFEDKELGILVMDECQTVKNSDSQVYAAAHSIRALHHVAISGTPVEDNLFELWSLMSILNPMLLGSRRLFNDRFVKPIVSNMERQRSETLHDMVMPFFLRRRKEEVLTDLPPVQEDVIYCDMTDEQAATYSTELSKARNEVMDDQGQNSLLVINAITRLRQIADGDGKLQTLMERLEEIHSTQHRVLIFSSFVTFLDRIAAQLNDRGWTYEMLTGESTDRESIVKRFQQGNTQFFLLSLKAAGVGLNLTEADYVFLMEPWWNKSPEEQAIGRAHRIGQNRPVNVYRFITSNTLEEQILKLQGKKEEIIRQVLG